MLSAIASFAVLVVFLGGLAAAHYLWDRRPMLAWGFLVLGLATGLFMTVLITLELGHLSTSH